MLFLPPPAVPLVVLLLYPTGILVAGVGEKLPVTQSELRLGTLLNGQIYGQGHDTYAVASQVLHHGFKV